jgi:hypothetical protein
MKLKNKVRRKLIPIIAKDNLKNLDEIKFKDKVVGKILIDGAYPFALIRLFDPNFSEFYKENLKVNETDVQILTPSHLKF